MSLLTKSEDIIVPTIEEIKKKELIETLTQLVKAYADKKFNS